MIAACQKKLVDTEEIVDQGSKIKLSNLFHCM